MLLVWPAARTTWDAASQSIVFIEGGQAHQLTAGQRVSFGGSGGSPAQLDGLAWVVPPMPECAAPAYWFVGGVVDGG